MKFSITSILLLAILISWADVNAGGSKEKASKPPNKSKNNSKSCSSEGKNCTHVPCPYNSAFWELDEELHEIEDEDEDCFNFDCNVCDEIVRKCKCSDCELCDDEILRECHEILKECKPCNNCTNFNCHQCTVNDFNQCGSTHPTRPPHQTHPTRPHSGEGTKKPHSGEGTKKPHSGEGTKKPHSGEGTKKPHSGEGTKKFHSGEGTKKPHSGEKTTTQKTKPTTTQKTKPTPAPHTPPMPPQKSSMKPATQQPPKTTPSLITTTVKPPPCSRTCSFPYQCLLSFECRCPCGDCGYAVDTLFKPCDLYELCPPDYLKVMYSCCCNTSTPVIEGGKIPPGCNCSEYQLINILNYMTNVKPQTAPLPAPKKIKKTSENVPCNTTLTMPYYECCCTK